MQYAIASLLLCLVIGTAHAAPAPNVIEAAKREGKTDLVDQRQR